jgi:O-antigen/teichoic acid export membrane protein
MINTTPDDNQLPSSANLGPPVHDKSLGRRFFHNSVALAIGWNINAVGRLAAASLVVRALGTTVFGEYALLIVWLTISEWILDFGTTEVFVREVNHEPERRGHLVRIFFALKALQAPLAFFVLTTGLLVMHYSQRIVVAGLLAGISLFFTAGTALCRAIFKSTLTMNREVFAEFISVVVMVCLIPFVAHYGLGIMGIMSTYVISRGAFLAGCLIMAGSQVPYSVAGITSEDLRWAIHSSFLIGIIGFIVVVYNTVDLLVLSRVSSLSDVAVYSAAQRFTTPLSMAVSAIAASLYPVLSLLKSKDKFRETCQRTVDTVLLFGCYALVGLWCGAEFVMGLMGHQFVYGAGALRILALVCVIRALPIVIGPVLFLMRAQTYALGYMIMALTVKVAVVTVVARRYGYMGAAYANLCVELFFLTPVTLYFVYVTTGFRIRFLGMWRLALAVVSVICVTRTIIPSGNIAGAIMAAILFPLVILGLRVVKFSEVRALLG